MRFPHIKPVEFIPQGTKIPFVSFFNWAFGLSTAINLGTILLIVLVGLNFGIDFRGGTLMEVRNASGAADIGGIRKTLDGLDLGDTQIQQFGTPQDVMIRFAEQPGGEKAQQEAVGRIRSALGQGIEVRRVEVVGSTVSRELITNALWALVLTCIGIFIYVWFRFEWQFAIGTIIALLHDVFATVGVFALFRLDFDLTTVAALLTILGYSVNDTVVIYDRIRENLRKYKKMPLRELIDLSINETLSRTIMTAGTTFIALLALYFFGGEVIRGFTFAMLFGVIIGTYSSIFIAAPFLILLGVSRDWSKNAPAATAGAPKPTAAKPAPAAIAPTAAPRIADEPVATTKPPQRPGTRPRPKRQGAR